MNILKNQSHKGTENACQIMSYFHKVHKKHFPVLPYLLRWTPSKATAVLHVKVQLGFIV